MVCPRCVLSVETILSDLNMAYKKVIPGEVTLEQVPSSTELAAFESELRKVGFELIETRLNKLIENIKLLVLEYVIRSGKEQKINLSAFITQHIPNDYSYLSDLFSSAEGISIEQFFITQRIEKVKELLVYDQLSLTEIAYQTGFSSVHHLSAQFKKHTGLTPSYFKGIGQAKRAKS